MERGASGGKGGKLWKGGQVMERGATTSEARLVITSREMRFCFPMRSLRVKRNRCGLRN